MNVRRPALTLPSIIALTSLLLPGVAGAEDAVSLKHQWMPGKHYSYENETEMTQDITIPTMPAPMKQEMKQVQEYNVTVSPQEADRSKKLVMTVAAIKQEMKMGPQVMKFDSKAPAGENASSPLAPMLEKLVGTKMTVTVDEAGEIQKVEGLDELLASTGAGKTPLPGFNDASVKQMMGQANALLPPNPVRPGDKWTTETPAEIPGIGKVEMKSESTFDRWEEHGGYRCAVLNFTGTMSISSTPGGNEANIKINTRDGKISGTSWFAPEIGTIVETRMNQDADFDMEVAAPGAAESMKITSKMAMKVSSKLKSFEDAK